MRPPPDVRDFPCPERGCGAGVNEPCCDEAGPVMTHHKKRWDLVVRAWHE
ncbi:MAG TPA: hypothetical protein VM681_05575 [Candidatus Thermoplasmatota archaeon]|nr:hypothetical protein [Candidatus Thermoplasmatota archaeon]